jgi:outer membrane protein OmpA-like peptidoglycan-associated protein
MATAVFAQGSSGVASERSTSFGVDMFAGGHYFAQGTNLGVTSADDASAGARGNALVGLRASLGLNQWAAAEIEFLGMLTSDRTYGRRASILGYRVNAVAYLMHGNIRPFVLVGAGAIEVVATRAEGAAGLVRDTDGEYHVGAGVEYRLLDHLSARMDARVVQMPGKQSWSLASDFEATLGVAVPLGAGPRQRPQMEVKPTSLTPVATPAPTSESPAQPSVAAPPAAATPKPEIPAPVAAPPTPPTTVSAVPAAPAAPAAPVTAPPTPTTVSAAPAAPASAPAVATPPVAVEAAAKPVKARAPAATPSSSPPAAPPVVSKGGSVKELLGRAKEIQFEGLTSKLSLVSLPFIGQLAEALTNEPSVELEIVSHTGGSGDKAKDMALSKRRSEAVKKALVQREVKASRLTATGKGSEEPLVPNITNSGRKQNERMELRPLGTQPKAQVIP